MNSFEISPILSPVGLEYAAALNSVSDAIIVADMEGCVTYLNPAAEQLTGWTREDAIGQDIATVYDVVNEQTGQEIIRLLTRFVPESEMVKATVNMLLIVKGGGQMPVTESVAPLRDAQQAIIGVVVAFHDVTAEREAQREIEALNERLRVAVAEVNHRVRNNLQIVVSIVEMQANSETEPLPQGAARRLTLHFRTLAHIHDLQTERAKTTVLDIISTHDTMGKLMPMLQATVSPRLVQFTGVELQLSVRLCTALALITNELVSNAFTHSRGNVEVALSVSEESAHLRITDHGKGFSADFDARVEAKTGLGLVETLSRHDMGGRVRYETLPEGGGCVTISFPLPPASPGQNDF